MERMGADRAEMPQPVLDAEGLFRARDAVSHGIFVDERLKEYILSLVAATRDPAAANLKPLAPLIALGASPRATLALLKTSKAHAFLRGSGHVAPEDIRQVAPDVLRHRIALSFEAEAESISADRIIEQVISRVTVP